MARSVRSSTSKPRRSIVARTLAALALVACGFAIFALISAFMSESEDAAEPDKERKARSEQIEKQEQESEAETYTVVDGDTLSAIAEKTGVRLPRLQDLNPDLDAETLNGGQVLKLR